MPLKFLHPLYHGVNLALGNQIPHGVLQRRPVQLPHLLGQVPVNKRHGLHPFSKPLILEIRLLLVPKGKVIVNPLEADDISLPVFIRLAKLIEHISCVSVILGAEKIKNLHGGHIPVQPRRGLYFCLAHHPLHPVVLWQEVNALCLLHKPYAPLSAYGAFLGLLALTMFTALSLVMAVSLRLATWA